MGESQILENSNTQISEYTSKPNTSNTKYKFKYTIYIASVCSAASFAGLIGTYSIIKKYMAEELKLQEGFLGILDSMTFLGKLVGYLYLTFKPATAPKKDFFKHCIFATFMLSLVPLSPFIPQFSSLVLILAMLLSGISRAYLIIPNMIMLQYFNINNEIDSIFINFWTALSTMGDVLAITFASLLMNAKINWRICFGLTLAIFFICSIILFVLADEISMQNPKQTTLETQQSKNSHKDNIKFIKQFYSQPSNFYWLIQYSFISIMYYNTLMWFPYYFLQYGFQFQASVISIMYPTFALVGVAFFEYFLRRFNYFENHLVSVLHFWNFMVYFCMIFLSNDPKYIFIYILLVAFSGLFQGGPYSQVTSVELRAITKNNKQTFLAMTTCKVIFQIFIIFMMTLIGFLMQNNLRSFLYVVVWNTMMTFLVHFYRVFKYGCFLNRIKKVDAQQNLENLQASEGMRIKSLVFSEDQIIEIEMKERLIMKDNPEDISLKTST